MTTLLSWTTSMTIRQDSSFRLLVLLNSEISSIGFDEATDLVEDFTPVLDRLLLLLLDLLLLLLEDPPWLLLVPTTLDLSLI